jgi:hypothetical protein
MTIVLSQPPSVSSYLVNSLLHTELSIETVNKDKNNKTARKGRFYHLEKEELTPDAESGNQSLVTAFVLAVDISQKAFASADELQ